jgi:hypothetical protein
MVMDDRDLINKNKRGKFLVLQGGYHHWVYKKMGRSMVWGRNLESIEML